MPFPPSAHKPARAGTGRSFPRERAGGAPLVWRGESFLVVGGSLAPDRERRQQRRRGVGASLGVQAGLVLLMGAALAIGPKPVRTPLLAEAHRLTFWILSPPPPPVVVAPRRRAVAPAAGRAPQRLLAEVPEPEAPPRPRLAQAAPFAAPLPPQVAGLEKEALPQVALPQVSPPQPSLGSFGAPAGLRAAAGAPVAVAELGQFGPSAAPAAPAPGGALVAEGGAGFGGERTLAGAVGAGAGAVHAAGFGRAPAAQPGASGPIALRRFAAATPRVEEELAPAAALPADFQAPEILSWPQPAYTARAAADRREGEVVLELRLGADGSVTVLRVVRRLGDGLDESAAAAARQLQFRPARRQGTPVAWTVALHIHFRLAY